MAKADLRVIERTARKQGWIVELTRSGHIKFVPPDPGTPALVTAGTPSDRRGLRNLRADLRRRGLQFA